MIMIMTMLTMGSLQLLYPAAKRNKPAVFALSPETDEWEMDRCDLVASKRDDGDDDKCDMNLYMIGKIVFYCQHFESSSIAVVKRKNSLVSRVKRDLYCRLYRKLVM